jgi:hypothetical protein
MATAGPSQHFLDCCCKKQNPIDLPRQAQDAAGTSHDTSARSLTDIEYGNMHYDNRTQAQAIIDQAGRRTVIPPPVVPPLSPPITNADYHAHDCAAPPAPPPPPPGPPAPPPPPPPSSFAAGKCTKNRVSQQWSLSDGVVPGDGKPTIVLSAMHGAPGEPQSLCWEIAECSDRGTLHY